MISRGDEAEPVQGRDKTMPLRGKTGPGMQREQHRQAELAQLVEYGPEALRVVGVLRPMDCGQDILARLGAQVAGDHPRRAFIRKHAERSLNDRVASEFDLPCW